MPTRKPKRTNWKQLAGDREVYTEAYKASMEHFEREAKRAIERAESAEARNAELLKERDEWGVGSNCDTCGVELSPQITRVRRFCANGVCAPTLGPKSWLRRNWVELTVMATVLGAIAFVVWRAWRG